jgi:hypothetical protein
MRRDGSSAPLNVATFRALSMVIITRKNGLYVACCRQAALSVNIVPS